MSGTGSALRAAHPSIAASTAAPHPARYKLRERSDDRSVIAYADDPFKAMTREYDARIVAKGGDSIFGPPPKWWF